MYSQNNKRGNYRTDQPSPLLSGYELMWMMVLFDLPVVEKQERKEATDFRNFLLDEGFSMAQYSVYYKLLSGKEAVEGYLKRIQENLPTCGRVDIVYLTDKQYENIVSFSGRVKKEKEKNAHKQFLLF